MQRIVRTMRVTYPDIHIPQWQGRKLRGFFASEQPSGSFLHNHGASGRDLYRYPRVQYKVIGQSPTVLALEEGIAVLQPLVLNSRELLLGGRSYPCGRMVLAMEDAALGDAEQPCRYRFCTPWFALNQDNYRRYTRIGAEDRKQLLEEILAGNILSLAKSLDVQVEGRLAAAAGLQEQPVRFKSETVLGFVGEFTVNYCLPDLIGLGKSVSRGFGAVRRIS